MAKERKTALPRLLKTLLLFPALLLFFPSCKKQEPVVREIGGKKYELTFEDDFDGETLDKKKWSLCPEQPRHDAGGWWDDDMVSLRDGCLVLTAAMREDGTPVSGAIRSFRKFSQNRGYFEARIRTQTASGFWGAFWLMDPFMSFHKPDGTAADGAEIDIMESFNVPRGGVNHAIHWDGYGEAHKSVGKEVYDRGLYRDFHVYALEWTDSEYIFYIDGKETWRTSEPGMCKNKLYLKLTTEFGTWAAPIEKDKLPDEFLVDYVRVYKLCEEEN